MPLIVETGAGLPDADSFVSVAEATAYHQSMANTAWASLSDEQREPLLRRATAFMEQVYRLQWAGQRTTAAQALSWPRLRVPVENCGEMAFHEVPRQVRQACAELALRAITADLAPDLRQAKASAKVGPIEVEYAEGSSQVVRFRAVDNMLAPFLAGQGGGLNMKLVRA